MFSTINWACFLWTGTWTPVKYSKIGCLLLSWWQTDFAQLMHSVVTWKNITMHVLHSCVVMASSSLMVREWSHSCRNSQQVYQEKMNCTVHAHLSSKVISVYLYQNKMNRPCTSTHSYDYIQWWLWSTYTIFLVHWIN